MNFGHKREFSQVQGDTPSNLVISYHQMTIGTKIHFFGTESPAFNSDGITHLSFFSTPMKSAHRLVKFGFTAGTYTADIVASCTRSTPQYTADGFDYGPLYVLKVRKSNSGIEVVEKWMLPGPKSSSYDPAFGTGFSQSTDAFGQVEVAPTDTSTMPTAQTMTKKTAIDLLNDPEHGEYFLQVMSTAARIRAEQLQAAIKKLGI
jgi:hypothetical protein